MTTSPTPSSASSPRRPATRPTCWTSTSTWRPTSASTPSSRPRCSPRSAGYGVERDDKLKLRDYPTLTHVVGCRATRPHAGASPKTAPGDAAASPTGAAVAAPRATATSPPPTGSRAGSRWPCCDRPLDVRADRRDARRRHPGRGDADQGGVGSPARRRLRRARRRGRWCSTPADRQLERSSLVDAQGRSTACTGWRRSTTRDRSSDMDLAAWHEACAVGSRTSTSRCDALVTTAARSWSRDPPRRVPRLRRGGASCPLGGAVTGFAKAYQRERPDALVKAVDFRRPCRQDRRRWPSSWSTRRCATPAASRSATPGRPALERRPARVPLRCTAAGRAGELWAPTASSSSPAPPAASSRRSRRPGRGLGGDLPPARPDARRPTRATRIWSGSSRTATGLKPTSPRGCKAGGERPTPVPGRAGAGSHRAAATPRWPRSRPSSAAGGTAHLAPGRPDRRRRGGSGRWPRCASTSGRIDVLLHAAGVEISHALPDKEPARVRPGASTSRATAGSTCCAPIGDMPLGATVAFSSVAGRFGNVGPDRLQRRQRPAVQDDVSSLRRDAPGRARHRRRLDRVGRHRHGQPAARSRR